MAVRVQAALGGMTVEMWLRIQASYDAHHIVKRMDVSHIGRLDYPVELRKKMGLQTLRLLVTPLHSQ